MSRLIDADALMKEFAEFVKDSNNSDFADAPTWNDAVSLVGSAPTIEERKKGKWMTILYHIPDEGDELYEHYCSECKKTVMISSLKKGRFNYCPNCGARMVE